MEENNNEKNEQLNQNENQDMNQTNNDVDNAVIEEVEGRDPYSDYNEVDLSKVNLKERFKNIKPLNSKLDIVFDDEDDKRNKELGSVNDIFSGDKGTGDDDKEVNPDNIYAKSINLKTPKIVKGKDTVKIKDERYKKERQPIGCGGALVIFILLILIVLGIILISQLIKNNDRTNRITKSLSYEEITDDLQKEKSDISKMSAYDKLKEEYRIEDDSDTDGDGLTDKYELEESKTNPKKVSTSSDSIPDSYKVKNNLKTNTSYNLKDINDNSLFKAPNNVSLQDKKAENAYVRVDENSNFINGIKFEKGYAIYNYTGDIEIDFSRYMSDPAGYSAYLVTPELYDNVKELVITDKGLVSANIQVEGSVIGIINFESKINAEKDNGIIFGRRAIAFSLTQQYNDNNEEATVYIVEESSTENDVDRSIELSKKISELVGLNVTVHHKIVSTLEYDMVLWCSNVFSREGNIIDFLVGKKEGKNEKINFDNLFIYQKFDQGLWTQRGEKEAYDTLNSIRYNDSSSSKLAKIDIKDTYNNKNEWQQIEHLKAYLANTGKDATATLLAYQSGEVKLIDVEVYGIEQIANDPNSLYLLVYDRNLKEEKDISYKIKVTKYIDYDGEKEKERYYFDYYPVNGITKYHFTNIKNVTVKYGNINFFDTNLKVIE